MSQVSGCLRSVKGPVTAGFAHWCPGCESLHQIITRNLPGRPQWSFDGNLAAPTFAPSARVTHGDGRVCHYFLRSGRIEYCADTWHSLAGQVVPLPELPPPWRDP